MVNPDRLSGRLGNRMFQMAYLYAQVGDGKIPDWYVQDQKYFKKYEKDIKELFGEGIGFLPFVGIHVRRGDYVNNPFYVDLTQKEVSYDLGGSDEIPSYYDRAMEMFPDSDFLVFSDDPAFCKEYFKDKKRVQVVEGGSDIDDFNQLASCEKGIIMANSSFSWWAAYLNPSPIKKIIAPMRWYSDGIERTKLPKEWIQI